MGYRFNDKPPKPEDHLRRFPVRNGATLKLAFACYYLKGHNADLHDHVGWPNPDHIDGICQERSNFKLFNLKHKDVDFENIDLSEEGYTNIAMSFEDGDEAIYLTPTAWFDEDDNNIIHVEIGTDFPTFSDNPIDIKFTLFIRNETVVDAVCHGIITVLPGSPYPG